MIRPSLLVTTGTCCCTEVVDCSLNEAVVHADRRAARIGFINPVEQNDQPQIVGDRVVNL